MIDFIYSDFKEHPDEITCLSKFKRKREESQLNRSVLFYLSNTFGKNH